MALSKDSIRIVCISDTHDLQPELPHGDILLHAGDLTSRGTFEQLQTQLDWLNQQPHRYKVVIAGNHDLLLDDNFDQPGRLVREFGKERKDLSWGSIIYLQNESTTLAFPSGRQLKLYGSPWTSQCGPWAFQYPPIRDVFSGTIPPGTDILITHGPPQHHLDMGDARGCPHLAKEIWRYRDSLQLVVFGHIHEGHGREELTFDRNQQLREEIRLGVRGGLFMVELALRILVERVKVLLPSKVSPQLGEPRTITLVNAAIATTPWEKDSRLPIVVEI
ncbi:MAG: hypothetical protein Q9209_004833 [Squamulea sp. 1 TL-2023]